MELKELEKIDFENMYFHGLCGNVITINSDELIINASLEYLDAIINSGGLFSRNELSKRNVNYSWNPVYNGNDYISLCVKNPAEEEFTGINEGLESSYNTYINANRIAIIIDKSIAATSIFREDTELFMPGERQVKNKIDISSFVGISVMFDNEESASLASSKIYELLEEHNINLPVVDKNLCKIEQFRKLTR